MSARPVLFGLLAVVAGAAAVLSFAALDELGALCGFGALSALLPVVVDAGAAAGSVAWLSRATTPRARVFGRALALVLLAGSVAGNALSHGLSAYLVAPAWWVVVAVSAVPPAVLGAVTHLGVLATSPRSTTPPGGHHGPGTGREPRPVPGAAAQTQPPLPRGDEALPPAGETAPPAGDDAGEDRAGALIAAGAGRRRLSRELSISEHEARALLATHRNGDLR